MEREDKLNCNRKINPRVSNKEVGYSQRIICKKGLISTEYILRKQQNLGCTNNQSNSHIFWSGESGNDNTH